MPKITYLHPDGATDVLDVADGTSVMQAAVTAGVDGIVGECGGNAMCATCHVYVDADSDVALPDVSVAEDCMLDSTLSERTPQSRLSCQLLVGPGLDGLVLHLPEEQV